MVPGKRVSQTGSLGQPPCIWRSKFPFPRTSPYAWLRYYCRACAALQHWTVRFFNDSFLPGFTKAIHFPPTYSSEILTPTCAWTKVQCQVTHPSPTTATTTDPKYVWHIQFNYHSLKTYTVPSFHVVSVVHLLQKHWWALHRRHKVPQIQWQPLCSWRRHKGNWAGPLQLQRGHAERHGDLLGLHSGTALKLEGGWV